MPDSIELTELMAQRSAPGEQLQVARTLRAAFIDQAPDAEAMTQTADGERLVITHGGTPMTVSQLEAELEVLVIGE